MAQVNVSAKHYFEARIRWVKPGPGATKRTFYYPQ